MAISAITVATERSNYSRYGDDFSMITITGVATGGGASDQVTLTLARKVLSGQYQLWTITFALGTAAPDFSYEVDLRTLTDSDGFHIASISKEYNDYTVTAAAAANLSIKATAKLSVLPFTVDQMRSRWCFGLPLISYEQLQVRQQPQLVTGVTIIKPSFGAARGPYVLALAGASPRTLSWGNGSRIPLTPGRKVYVLPDVTGRNSVTVSVVAADLPGIATSETLFLDFAEITDEAIIRETIGSLSTVQEFINIHFEPTRIVTSAMLQIEPAVATVWERIGMGLNFYKPDNWLKWLEFTVPYRPLLKFYKLSGYFNQTKSIDIDTVQLITFDERSAQVSFVPSNLAVVNSFFVGPGIYIMFFNQIYVPQFWNYYVLAGYRDMPSAVIEYVAMRVAIKLLTIAGQGRYQAGTVGMSTSRDGVSESTSIQPGVYKAQIDRYDLEIGRQPDGHDTMLISLRNRFRGLAFTSL